MDNEGNAYVTGLTWSTDFPTTNALQPDYGGHNHRLCLVTKFNANRVSFWSTPRTWAAADRTKSYGIAVDSSGNAYVTGDTSSTDFPTTRGVLQTTYGGSTDAFVSELNPTGSALVYSTYLGGSGGGVGYGIAVDSAGNAYVTGYTSSTDFPVTPGAFQTVCGCGGYEDVFLSRSTRQEQIWFTLPTLVEATRTLGLASRWAALEKLTSPVALSQLTFPPRLARSRQFAAVAADIGTPS